MTKLKIKWKRNKHEKYWNIKEMSEISFGLFVGNLFDKTDLKEMIVKIERFDAKYTEGAKE